MTDALRDKSFRWLFDAAVDPMLVVDGRGTVVLANPAARKLFGHTVTEFDGLEIGDLMPERLRAGHRRHIEEYARRPRSRAMGAGLDLRGLRRDGSEFPADISLSPIEDGLVLATIHDMTERRRAEEALQALHAEMERLTTLHVASQTAAAIAHDLSQPLNAITTYNEAALRLLRAGNPTPEKLVRALQGSADQAQRAGQVVRELLELLNKGEARHEAVDLGDAVRHALSVVGANGYGGFQAVLDLATNLPRVHANHVQVEKALVILLQNGVEAMRDAGIVPLAITIAARASVDGRMAQVTVRDGGPGIDEGTLPRIFDPFFSTKPNGLGMGLCISRAIVETHGGSLWAESSPGSGASFHFTLPFAA